MQIAGRGGESRYPGILLGWSGAPVDVHSRSCTPMYWYVQVPVVSLCIVPLGYLRPPQPHLRDLPPRAIWKLKLSAIRMDIRVHKRTRVRHQLDSDVLMQ